MARRVVLVRHGRIEAGPGSLVGSSDLPLSAAGVAQVRRMSSLAEGQCYCSPLLRCRQTAEAAGLTATIDPALREIDFGLWEGQTFQQIAPQDPQLVRQWAEFDPAFTFPAGENLGEFLSRVHSAADRLAASPKDVALAVTHGGVIRAMICHMLGLPGRQYVLFNVGYGCAVTIDVQDGKGVLAGLEDVCSSRQPVEARDV